MLYLTQVQLLDAIHVLQNARSRHASVLSINFLKSFRWFQSTVQPDSFPSLCDDLSHSSSWREETVRKEAIPLPLALVYWPEEDILLHSYSPPHCIFAGSVLCCVWCSLRFEDAQHVALSDLLLDADSLRGVAYRTKAKKFMPFGCLAGGIDRMPTSSCWIE